MEEDRKMHGSMFLLLKKIIEGIYGESAWRGLLNTAPIKRDAYLMFESYPITEMRSIISAAAALMGISKNEVKEKFGEYLVPDLLNIYQSLSIFPGKLLICSEIRKR